MDAIYLLRKRETPGVSKEAGRYIGITSQPVEDRVYDHLLEARKGSRTHKSNWLRSIDEDVEVEVIEWCLPMHREEREKYWIALFRAYGCKLTNATDGGEGSAGLNHSPEAREKISAALTGRKRSPEIREKISAALTGKKHSLERREKVSKSKTGVRKSLEACAAAAAGRRGIKHAGSSSQFYGVYFDSRAGKWHARIRVNKIDVHIGRFLKEEDAARAVDAYIRENNLPTRLLNFP